MARATPRALRSAVLASAVALAAAGPVAGQAGPPARNRALLELVNRFLERPTDVRLRRAVFDSATARRDVTVELSSAITPWICYGDTASWVRDQDSTLTVAFIAGNIAAQLADGHKGDRPRPAVLTVLRTYLVVQREAPGYLVPELDRWRTESAGQLGPLADRLKAAPGRDCPDPKPRRYGGRMRIIRRSDSLH